MDHWGQRSLTREEGDEKEESRMTKRYIIQCTCIIKLTTVLILDTESVVLATSNHTSKMQGQVKRHGIFLLILA